MIPNPYHNWTGANGHKQSTVSCMNGKPPFLDIGDLFAQFIAIELSLQRLEFVNIRG